MKTKTIHRSSITGQIVTEDFAKANPDTTQKETILNPKGIERNELVKFCDFYEKETGKPIDYSLIDEYLKER
jgi:hypothetical protein